MVLDQIKHAVSVAVLSALVATFAIQDADGAELERARRYYDYYYKTETYTYDDDYYYSYTSLYGNASKVGRIVGGVIAGICVLGLCGAAFFFLVIAGSSNNARGGVHPVGLAVVAGAAGGAAAARGAAGGQPIYNSGGTQIGVFPAKAQDANPGNPAAVIAVAVPATVAVAVAAPAASAAGDAPPAYVPSSDVKY
jgi:hypothetical protein